MSVRSIDFEKGEYYHAYNRGNSKRDIFHDNEDAEHFQNLLYVSNNPERFTTRSSTKKKTKSLLPEKEVKLVAIGAYCLMSNHFHILFTPLVEDGASKFMQKLSTAYSMYYNKKYKHTGGLFEGKFKAKHLNNDRYLKYIFSYIHLNPIKYIDADWKEKGIKNIKKSLLFLEKYKYSSYYDFAHTKENEIREESDILSLKNFPSYFPTNEDFKNEIMIWFLYNKNT